MTASQVSTRDFDVVPGDDSEVIAVHSKSFSAAARLLPREVRRDAELLYAWCRWCDDAVDNAPTTDVARARLQTLREDVHRVYRAQPTTHAASRWLERVLSRNAIPRQLCLDLLDGMEMDLFHEPFHDESELDLYCYRAAGSVGLMMCYVLGASRPAAMRHAEALGMAMQMTNIARDVREDWQRGRCYLPRTWLVEDFDSARLPSHDRVRTAVQRLLNRADRYYEVGLEGLTELPSGVRPAIWIAAKLYHSIGETIRGRHYRVLDGRTCVPRTRKASVVLVGLARLAAMRTREHCRRLVWNAAPARRHPVRNLYSLPIEVLPMKPLSTDSAYLASIGLSLTLTMATALFILVGVNPKQADYSNLPWIYAAMSAVAAFATNWLARRIDASARQPAVQQLPQR